MRTVNYLTIRRVAVIFTISMALASCGILQVSIEAGEDENNKLPLVTDEALDVIETANDNKPGLVINATMGPGLQKATPTAEATNTAIAETGHPTMTAQASETSALAITQEDWLALESEELGITFQYPIVQQMLDEVVYRFDEWPDRDWDPTGTFYAWDATRLDSGWRYSFVGGASADGKEGRERWITDVYRWAQEGDTHLLELCGGARQEIVPLMIVAREDGLIGLIFEHPDWSEGPDEQNLAATLNFPVGYHEDLGSITFYFYEEASLDLIREVLESVTFREQ